MSSKKIFILLGHPDKTGITGALVDAYEAGALHAGHEVRRLNIGEIHFDPILHHGYKTIQELEPDLKTFQENVKWCTHFVIVYPNWWDGMPALMKGLFDRAWLPGFSFKMHGMYWDKLLHGRSARLIICANTPRVLSWLLFGDYMHELSHAILKFSGFYPVKLSVFAPSEKSSDAQREHWKREVNLLGQRAN